MESTTAAAELETFETRVQSLSQDELLQYITGLEDKWRLSDTNDKWKSLTNCFELYYTRDQRDSDGFPIDPDPESIDGKHNRRWKCLVKIRNRVKSLGIGSTESENINGHSFDVNTRLSTLIELEKKYFKQLKCFIGIDDIINHPTAVRADADMDLSEVTVEDRSEFQNLLIDLLDVLDEKKYHRYNGQCCEQIKTAKGYSTRAWKPIMKINEFVYHTCQRDYNPTLWKYLTSRGNNARECTKYLSDCREMSFPDVEKNRHIWSFNNGIFHGKVEENGKITCKFYPYESRELLMLESKNVLVSSNYFDKDFVDCSDIENWWDIPTPHFQSIMDYQKFEGEVSNWMYVMGGKLCYDVGDIDSWQIIPFLKGIARSGKSTIITKVFKRFYESEDVRTLSNNIEKKFGLSSIYDGFMFIAPEVKGDLCLEQAEFQSLVSGEDVSIARKYENAKSVEWKTPGILGGNEIPNWKDNSGSVLRRLLPWNFGKQVMEADPHLEKKLDVELPLILLKCVRAYLDYAQKYSNQDIWNVVPKYFKNIQTQVAMVTNSLQNFLACEKVKYGEELFCPQKLFVQLFNQHCQENNLGRFKFNPDFYAGPFSSRSIEVRSEAKIYKGRAYPVQPVIFGIDIVEDTMQFSEDF
jgi:hypothetical protein